MTEKVVQLKELQEHPDNPRSITAEDLEELQASLKDFPEMLEARPIIINKQNQVIGGNQRLKALLANGETETKVKVVDWSEDQQREFIIKDNTTKGEWDYNELVNKWKTEDLEKWGVSIGTWKPVYEPDQEQEEYTDEDVAKTQEQLENKYRDADAREMVTIHCKKCGREYYADKG